MQKHEPEEDASLNQDENWKQYLYNLSQMTNMSW